MEFGNPYALRVLLPLLLVVGACTLLPFAHCITPSLFGESGRNSVINKDLCSGDHEIHYYTQVLDHFTYKPEGYNTFHQRYLVNKNHWGGPQSHSPIFVIMGAEGAIGDLFNATCFNLYQIGFVNETAAQFQALVVYIEHRYYGLSMPFGSADDSFRNASTLGYLTSTQALADYATLILDLKKNLSAENCPVVVIGGSYGGMLAAWFRLKYPHITIGALAASAPILYFDNLTPYDAFYRVVTDDFRDASESCYTAIKESWAEINKVASQPGGLESLQRTFNACKAFDTSTLINWLVYAYEWPAQYDYQLVKLMCKAIDSFPAGTAILTRISAAATVSYTSITPTTSNNTCLNLQQSSDDYNGWDWQSCTEMVMPMSTTPNTTMFPLDLFNMTSYSENCESQYGVVPRPHWITTEFGGHEIRRVLKRFGSNIIFSNGLRDPYSCGGMKESISDSIIALVTNEGTHCQDLLFSSKEDPDWLREQRSKEIEIIKTWVKQYTDNLYG